MQLLNVTAFIAHFHPVLVHLPIGFLLAALILLGLAQKEKYAALRPAAPILLLAGLVSAVFSCVTGYLLASGGDYDMDTVHWHMWMGIGLTLLSILLYIRVRRHGFDRMNNILSVILLGLILLTGHLGGSLTHGAGYLTDPLKDNAINGSNGSAVIAGVSNISDVQEAKAYEDIIHPIFQARCANCHGPNKQKGGFRLDQAEDLMKGGKDGLAIIAGKAAESELMKRLLLPADDEHHMPPKEKSPLTAEQLALINWWIDQGADPVKKVKELAQTEKIKSVLLAFQKGDAAKHGDHVTQLDDHIRQHASDIPVDPVDPADDKAVSALREKGVLLIPVARSSNYLQAEFIGISGYPVSSLIPLLLPLKKQLVELKLGNSGIGDSAIDLIRQCQALVFLDLNNTNITDNGMGSLGALQELRVLNLTGTKLTAPGILKLRILKKLRRIYLYRTLVKETEWTSLTRAFPGVVLDSGGYQVPLFASDTVIVKTPSQNSQNPANKK